MKIIDDKSPKKNNKIKDFFKGNKFKAGVGVSVISLVLVLLVALGNLSLTGMFTPTEAVAGKDIMPFNSEEWNKAMGQYTDFVEETNELTNSEATFDRGTGMFEATQDNDLFDEYGGETQESLNYLSKILNTSFCYLFLKGKENTDKWTSRLQDMSEWNELYEQTYQTGDEVYLDFYGNLALLSNFYYDYINNNLTDFSENNDNKPLSVDDYARTYKNRYALLTKYLNENEFKKESYLTNDTLCLGCSKFAPILSKHEVKIEKIVKTDKFVISGIRSATVVPFALDGYSCMAAVFDKDDNLLNIMLTNPNAWNYFKEDGTSWKRDETLQWSELGLNFWVEEVEGDKGSEKALTDSNINMYIIHGSYLYLTEEEYFEIVNSLIIQLGGEDAAYDYINEVPEGSEYWNYLQQFGN